MNNLIVAMLLLITGTTVASASCVNGSCSKHPVKKAGSVVAQSTKRIVTAPFRVVNKARVNRLYR